jgi:hypothetical protein
LRKAVTNVMAASPALEEIVSVKASLAAPADAPSCAGDKAPGNARASSPLDGRYEYTTTKEDLLRVGVTDAVLENYGHQVWKLRKGHFRLDQDNGPTCDTWTTGTFTVRGDTLTFRVEHAGGRAPHGTGPNSWLAKPGEVWTYGWSLYRGALKLHAVDGAISPEPNLAKPWRKLR